MSRHRFCRAAVVRWLAAATRGEGSGQLQRRRLRLALPSAQSPPISRLLRPVHVRGQLRQAHGRARLLLPLLLQLLRLHRAR